MKKHCRHISIKNAISKAADIKFMLQQISKHNYEYEDLFKHIIREDILKHYSKQSKLVVLLLLLLLLL